MSGPILDLAKLEALRKPVAEERGCEDPDEETFIERTRRVHEATQRRRKRPPQFARGLDSRPEDFA